jgi:4-hydroxybenzoate polyprenyltransferase
MSNSSRVLCVDLDGTLVATDLLWESLVSTIRRKPAMLLNLPIWLLRGRAYLKQRLAEVSSVDFTTLPYRPEVIEFVNGERRNGRTVVLATAADQVLAAGVSKHLGMFSAVLASDGVTNLKGPVKAALLSDRFGRGNFDYIGDSTADIPCWESAATAISTGSGRGARAVPHLRHLTADAKPEHPLAAMIAALRPHQWVKNALLVLPMLAGHRFDVGTALAVAIAFVSMSFCASGGYVLNDLLDVAADRQHPRKRTRPFSSGRLSLSTGVWLILGTWIVGFGLAALLLPGAFAILSAVYLLTTIAYSLRLKREPILDVMTLSGLYVMRVIAGGVATGIFVSNWLLAFTLFISLSLAFLKRFIEVSAREGNGEIPGRAYVSSDAGWLHSVGLSSAYLAVVVFALYANNPELTRLYTHPDRLMVICPPLLYWATRTWFKAHRRLLHDDPVVAIARDPWTYVVGAVAMGVVLNAI